MTSRAVGAEDIVDIRGHDELPCTGIERSTPLPELRTSKAESPLEILPPIQQVALSDVHLACGESMGELNWNFLDVQESAEMLRVLQWVQRAMARLAMSLKMLTVLIAVVKFAPAHSIWQCFPPLTR